MRNGHIQSAENGVGQTQKQGDTAANWRAAEQRVALLNNRRNTPLSGKEKGDTVFTDTATQKGQRNCQSSSFSCLLHTMGKLRHKVCIEISTSPIMIL